MSVVFTGLMCHAPIVHPDVAGADAERCIATTRAMREVAARAVASGPDRLVLVSPHSPRHRTRWGAWRGRHRGDLGRFRAPHLSVDLPDAPEVWRALDLVESRGEELDHGAMVPLRFLWEAGWRGQTAILAPPWDEAGPEAVGHALAELPGSTAVVASGDMSHRLMPGAPAGFHPRAQDFDDAFVDALQTQQWSDVLRLPYRSEAAEDVVTTTRVALAAAAAFNPEVLSYEGPWGVGYTEAVFYDPNPPLYAIARQAIAARLGGGSYRPPPGPESRGIFVTLYLDGDLRGCIGCTGPSRADLYDAVADLALSAAFDDPRFPPLEAHEFDGIDIEISVLHPPEAITGPELLDPRRYGVIVTSGRRRGLLLPDIDGIDTVDEQVSIARRKGGIGKSDLVTLERFVVDKVAMP